MAKFYTSWKTPKTSGVKFLHNNWNTHWSSNILKLTYMTHLKFCLIIPIAIHYGKMLHWQRDYDYFPYLDTIIICTVYMWIATITVWPLTSVANLFWTKFTNEQSKPELYYQVLIVLFLYTPATHIIRSFILEWDSYLYAASIVV